MKYTAAALIALVSVDTVSGFSVSRSSLRQLSQPKNVAAPSQQHEVGSSMKMEGALAVVMLVVTLDDNRVCWWFIYDVTVMVSCANDLFSNFIFLLLVILSPFQQQLQL